MHPPHSTALRTLALAVSAIMIVACDGPETATVVPKPAASLAAGHGAHTSRVSNGQLTSSQLKAIAAVRAATNQFHSRETARQAGYDTQFPPGCAQLPGAGAQGFHYIDFLRVDATIELLRPELVMYEPQPDGSLQLVGVDYVVPFAAWTSPNPPTLLGVPFEPLDALGVWALHIWSRRPNPDGIFAMWNPKVSCKYEDRVLDP